MGPLCFAHPTLKSVPLMGSDCLDCQVSRYTKDLLISGLPQTLDVPNQNLKLSPSDLPCSLCSLCAFPVPNAGRGKQLRSFERSGSTRTLKTSYL